jgi:hypothetical protein
MQNINMTCLGESYCTRLLATNLAMELYFGLVVLHQSVLRSIRVFTERTRTKYLGFTVLLLTLNQCESMELISLSQIGQGEL